MPSPFEHNPRPTRGAPASIGGAASRSLHRRERERRVWAARSFTSLILLGLVVLGFILIRRDRTLRRRGVEALGAYVQILNVKLERQSREGWDHLMLPAEWDGTAVEPRPSLPFDFFHRYDDTLRDFAQNRDEPTMIAWADQPFPMMLGSDGRPVAIYEKGRVRVEWLTEREFNQRLDEQQEELETAVQEAERQTAVKR